MVSGHVSVASCIVVIYKPARPVRSDLIGLAWPVRSDPIDLAWEERIEVTIRLAWAIAWIVRSGSRSNLSMHVALAVSVHSATDIAELGSAPAAHMVAALSLLDPPLALVTLFESHALCELEERGVVFVHFLLDIVLLTGHPVVV